MVQVGRTGVLTPKAVLSPVRLAGTTVTNATLHNQDFITEKDIRVGDTVLVQKAGEIIPEILSVDFDKRPEGTVPYTLPDACPVCGAPVVRDEDGAALRCTGAECPAQLLRNLTHFASRDAMDIDGCGPAVIQQLIDAGLISNAADLYSLHAADVAKLDRMGEKSAENLIRAIENSKANDLSRLLYGLGIRQVGEKAAKIHRRPLRLHGRPDGRHGGGADGDSRRGRHHRPVHRGLLPGRPGEGPDPPPERGGGEYGEHRPAHAGTCWRD